MTNKKRGVVYTGSTNNLESRVIEHQEKSNKNAFTAKYNCDKLVYFESHSTLKEAIKRESQIKKWKRAWKVNMIESVNPDWKDLSFLNDTKRTRSTNDKKIAMMIKLLENVRVPHN